MAQQTINLGTTADDDTGDNLRSGGTKINANFSELYSGKANTSQKLDDFGAPDDNTDLDATTSAHGLMPKADKQKLDGIETGATADQSDAEILAAVQSESGRALATDGAKLDGIEAGATADQTGAEIKSAYEGEADTNAFTDAEKSKLAAIEAAADVTDAANVSAAGATMNTDTDVSSNSWVIDEDNMASNSPIKVPTQQSVKQYVDSNAGGNATSIQGTNVDSSVGTPSDGDILVFRSAGSDFVLEQKPAGGSNPAINDVTDITITSVADNEVLAYDSVSGDWINQTAAEAGLATSGHNHDGTYQPLDTALTALAGLNDTPVGTGADQVSAGNHNHTGVYEPADGTIIKQSDVDDTPVNGVTTAPVSSNWAYDHANNASAHGSYQPLDTALTALAALNDTPVGTGSDQVASGNHNHTGVYEPAGVSASDITDATADGIALITSADANPFTDANASKLAAIEASADVTDTANVTAAGALMDSEVTNLAAVKAFDPADYATAAQGSTADSAMQDLVDDTSPTLGGALDGGGNLISNYRNTVATGVSGSLTKAAHSGKYLVTSGNVTIPNASGDEGFCCVLIAGGAHTVTFNSTVCAAMAAGEMMTLFVQSTTVVRAVLTPVADQVVFS